MSVKLDRASLDYSEQDLISPESGLNSPNYQSGDPDHQPGDLKTGDLRHRDLKTREDIFCR